MLHLRTLGGLKLSGPSGDSLSRRRNDLAVLAVLADRSPAAIRREEMQTLFWGERPEEKARHSLRQVVLQFRRVCGDAVDMDTTSLRLLPDFVRYDAREFASAASEGRCREAIDLWTGDFLLGCEDLGAEAFRAWMDVERERLRRLLAFCYERTVVELEMTGDLDRAAQYASGWAERFPLDERPHQRLIELLSKIGRLADATVAHGTFIRRRHAEMEDEPSGDWLAATDRALREARDADAAGVSSRAASTRAAAATDAIPFIEKAKVEKVLFVSSTSVYNDSDLMVDENTIAFPETESGKQLLMVETMLLANKNFETTIIRFGGLIGKDRNPIKFLAGKKEIENPNAPINFIHQTDCIGIIIKIIELNVWNEIFNGVAPFHPTRKEYYCKKALEFGLVLPEFNESKPSIGKTVLSEKVERVLGYTFLGEI